MLPSYRKQDHAMSLHKAVLLRNSANYFINNQKITTCTVHEKKVIAAIHNQLSNPPIMPAELNLQPLYAPTLSPSLNLPSTSLDCANVDPSTIIYESSLKACAFLKKNDNDNFSNYEYPFQCWMTNSQNLAEKITFTYCALNECLESTSHKNTCCWSFFSKSKKSTIPSLTSIFINAFLEINTIDCKKTAQKFQKTVDDLINNKVCASLVQMQL